MCGGRSLPGEIPVVRAPARLRRVFFFLSARSSGFDSRTGHLSQIGIWGKENLIVEGHGRLEAAKQLAMETVPVIRLDHLTDEQRRAYALAHNKTAELSGWDFGTLESELDALEEMFSMGDFGFADFSAAADLPDAGRPGRGETGGGEDEPVVNSESSFKYKEQYAVTILVPGEREQRELYERMTAEGYDCRVVCV